MKVLPNYLSELMPAVEEAIEEIRLSVLDHCQEIQDCLDIDTLSSDKIREKLKIWGLQVDNMTAEWSPNGRFYKTYANLRRDRGSKASVESTIHTGGQFESLWSSLESYDRSTALAYANMKIYRHYENRGIRGSDGYFYLEETSSEGSNLRRLSSDILSRLTLPAGYTYVYVSNFLPVYYDVKQPTKACSVGYPYNVYDLTVEKAWSISEASMSSSSPLPILPASINPASPSTSHASQWYSFGSNGDTRTYSVIHHWPTSYYFKSVGKSSFPDSDQMIPYFNDPRPSSYGYISIEDSDKSYRLDQINESGTLRYKGYLSNFAVYQSFIPESENILSKTQNTLAPVDARHSYPRSFSQYERIKSSYDFPKDVDPREVCTTLQAPSLFKPSYNFKPAIGIDLDGFLHVAAYRKFPIDHNFVLYKGDPPGPIQRIEISTYLTLDYEVVVESMNDFYLVSDSGESIEYPCVKDIFTGLYLVFGWSESNSRVTQDYIESLGYSLKKNCNSINAPVSSLGYQTLGGRGDSVIFIAQNGANLRVWTYPYSDGGTDMSLSSFYSTYKPCVLRNIKDAIGIVTSSGIPVYSNGFPGGFDSYTKLYTISLSDTQPTLNQLTLDQVISNNYRILPISEFVLRLAGS